VPDSTDTRPPVDLKGPISPAQLRSALAELGWSSEQLSDELSVENEQLEAWERGDQVIPAIVAQRIRWHVANAERERALRASQLPECDWVANWEDSTPPEDDDLDATLAHLESLQQHAQACSVCTARERFLSERFAPLPPYPMPARFRLLGSLGNLVEHVPPFFRPPLVGALILGGIVAVRVVFAVPSLLRTPAEFLGALAALVAAAGAGAVGGVVYSVVRPPLRHLGRAGDYITGVASVAGYMGALIVVAPVAFGESLAEGVEAWIIWGITSLLFGLVVGHWWFGPKGFATF
jgi:transcriptional regulator with XRE-family HTH domain